MFTSNRSTPIGRAPRTLWVHIKKMIMFVEIASVVLVGPDVIKSGTPSPFTSASVRAGPTLWSMDEMRLVLPAWEDKFDEVSRDTGSGMPSPSTSSIAPDVTGAVLG